MTWTIRPEPVVPAGEVGRFSFALQAPAGMDSGSVEVELHLESTTNPEIAISSDFRMLLPAGNR